MCVYTRDRTPDLMLDRQELVPLTTELFPQPSYLHLNKNKDYYFSAKKVWTWGNFDRFSFLLQYNSSWNSIIIFPFPLQLCLRKEALLRTKPLLSTSLQKGSKCLFVCFGANDFNICNFFLFRGHRLTHTGSVTFHWVPFCLLPPDFSNKHCKADTSFLVLGVLFF